eukprot:13370999-Alexandrium_andersonii.AAC.1
MSNCSGSAVRLKRLVAMRLSQAGVGTSPEALLSDSLGPGRCPREVGLRRNRGPVLLNPRLVVVEAMLAGHGHD